MKYSQESMRFKTCGSRADSHSPVPIYAPTHSQLALSLMLGLWTWVSPKICACYCFSMRFWPFKGVRRTRQKLRAVGACVGGWVSLICRLQGTLGFLETTGSLLEGHTRCAVPDEFQLNIIFSINVFSVLCRTYPKTTSSIWICNGTENPIFLFATLATPFLSFACLGSRPSFPEAYSSRGIRERDADSMLFGSSEFV